MATSNAGSKGSNAGNTAGGGQSTPQSTAVVAPKGFRLALQQMLQGWQTAIPDGSALTINGSSMDKAAVVTLLGGYLAAYTALDAEALTHKAAHMAVREQLTAAHASYILFKDGIIAFLGRGSPLLAQFGLKPKRKPATLTAEQMLVRVAKSIATRKLRHTQGPRQKAGLKSGPLQVTIGPAAVPAHAGGGLTAAPGEPGGAGTPPVSK